MPNLATPSAHPRSRRFSALSSPIWSPTPSRTSAASWPKSWPPPTGRRRPGQSSRPRRDRDRALGDRQKSSAQRRRSGAASGRGRRRSQIEVAKRPLIGGEVVDAILSQAEPAVMIALAGNDTARLAGRHASDGRASRQVAGRARPWRATWLTADGWLYAWSDSPALGDRHRFRVDVEALDRALAESGQGGAVGAVPRSARATAS